MVRLTAYGGACEIGGNKILLEDGGARLLLDFGISYTRRGCFFDEYLKPRTAAGLVDLIVTGVLPQVPGLYRRDLLGMGGPGVPPPHTEPIVDALLLSHAHLDHAGHLGFLDERITTYCSSLSHHILVAMQGSRPRDFETEIIDFRPRPAYPDTRDTTVPRRFEEVEGEFRAGGLACRLLPVDHSILGAAAFLIRTSRGTILYTGDLRFHGPDASLSWASLERARAEGVWMLLTEGTRLDETQRRTEEDVFTECLAAVRAAPGPVIADFAPRDLYRLNTFVRVAQQTDRELVILPQDAYLLAELLGRHPFVPDPRRDPIVILKERKASGEYSERDYQKWERAVLALPSVRTAAQLRPRLPRLILALSFWDIQNLVDLEVGPDTRYIRSSSEAFTEEQELDDRRLKNWLEVLRIPAWLQSHASGHAPQADLKHMVEMLRPEILVPLHTEHPALWRSLVPGVQIVEPTAGTALTW